jgi:hypothetical protein
MIVEPTNKSVTELKGLHLFHADISNCSMRVRMALAKKKAYPGPAITSTCVRKKP